MGPKNETIGVIGHTGMVGKNVYRWLGDQGYEVHGYSLDKPEDEWATFNSDIIFVAVPTPFHYDTKRYDDSIIEATLKKMGPGRVVVIKSTIKVGTTDKFQKQFPALKILFNPEFLSESTCWEDFSCPDRQFVGYTDESFSMATKVLHLLPESPYDLICPAKEAELLKYINNMHGILEIMESNHYYDVCQKEGLDYERVIKAATASKWVGCPMGRHYRVIYHKGKRGAGGKCFPKDLNAWLEYCKENDIDCRLLQAARDYNEKLLMSQGLTEETSEKVSSAEDLEKILKKN